MAESFPGLYQLGSGKKLLGLGKNSFCINRDGNAETGVSISAKPLPEARTPFEMPFVEFWFDWLGFEPCEFVFVFEGGSGLANGFGGPVAPADCIVDVEGLGGGRVIIPMLLPLPPD